MRKFLMAFLLLIAIFYSLTACQSHPNISETSLSTTMETTTTRVSDSEMNVNENKQNDSISDIYGLSGSYNSFSKTMSQNPIDIQYQKDFGNAETTPTMCAVEKEYIEMWKKELAYSIENLKEELTDEDSYALDELQVEWESATLNQLSFERDMINNSDYGIHLGSAFQFTSLSQERTCYRERTLRIKYLLYLIESADSDKEESAFKSLRFLEQH